MLLNFVDRLGEYNPQLFRELKGRLKPRNIAIALGISVTFQLVIYYYFQRLLPGQKGDRYDWNYSDYCTAEDGGYSKAQCIKDLLGNWLIDWQSWWLDLFISMSAIGIILLLVFGTHMLIDDLSKEDSRGTLNFIRLSPQNASNILIGKILGVPILLYLAAIVILPFHLSAGLAAGIPFNLILGFYLVISASCIFFFSAALLLGLINFGLGEFSHIGLAGFKPWLGSGLVLGFLSLMTVVFSNSSILLRNCIDWITLFYPGVTLSYLAKATYLPVSHYRNSNRIDELLFYGQSLWENPWTGMSLIVLNYGLATYWIWKALPRHFENPNSTLLSKTQSYWLTGCFIAIATGFTLQEKYNLYNSFGILQFFIFIFFLCSIAALTHHRQTLQDWARYRHQNEGRYQNLWKDLVVGEKSPATVAIALNLGIVIAYMLPALLIFSFPPETTETVPILLGLLLCISTLLIYAAITQLMLMMKTKMRTIWATATIASLLIFPLGLAALFGISPEQNPWLFLFSFIPATATNSIAASHVSIALMGQWLAIVLINLRITKQLRSAGASNTKVLLNH
jgi:hypothetical protein